MLPEMPDDVETYIEEDGVLDSGEAQAGIHTMRGENITYLYRFASSISLRACMSIDVQDS